MHDLHGIDVNEETLLTIDEACAHQALRQTNGRPCHRSKAYRLFADRSLEFVRVPGFRTSKEAIARMVARMTYGDSAAALIPSQRERRKRLKVDAELDQILGPSASDTIACRVCLERIPKSAGRTICSPICENKLQQKIQRRTLRAQANLLADLSTISRRQSQ